jgi:hypothetical protein
LKAGLLQVNEKQSFHWVVFSFKRYFVR